MSIRILDENTINRIAAGEVIENPASVVKELVENSIDAEASHITIEIEGGGCELIKVSDNGVGFDKDEIKIAFANHSTSKLKTINDLDTLMSYGFRGEALASIASVSTVVLTSKKKSDNNLYGYSCTFENGIGTDIKETASNDGTTIEVKDLFKNLPVRKKFLKGIARENALVEDLVIKLALARPDISFELIIEKKSKFSSNGDSNYKNIIFSLYGKQVFDNLVEVNNNKDGIIVFGYIAKPIVARNNRNDEIYFLNGRLIKSKIISRAIEGAYEEFLMQHKYPLVILNIKVDCNIVDVNVHPKKLEVRFANDGLINNSIYGIVYNALCSTNLIHEEHILNNEVNSYNKEDIDSNHNSFIDLKFSSNENKTINIDSLSSLSSVINKPINEGITIPNFFDKTQRKFENETFIQKTLSDDHKYIGQIFNTYILVEYDEKLYIIDQHAAHEKINFENIMKLYKSGKPLNQKIFPSIIMKLTPLQFNAISANIDEFRKVGYEIEIFGDNDIKVDAVPYNILNISNEKLLLEMIDSFTDCKNKEQYDSIAEKIAAISCKKAIKANYVLSENEVKQLLRELFKLDNPYNCPHGRPTIISLSKQEFEKKFGRIV